MLQGKDAAAHPPQTPWQPSQPAEAVAVLLGYAQPNAGFFLNYRALVVGRPHHWVTPFLGKRGQIGLSRHNFASTAPFPDLSTPLDSLYFSGSDGGLGVEIGAVSVRQFRKNGMLRWRSARCFPLPAPNSELEMTTDV